MEERKKRIQERAKQRKRRKKIQKEVSIKVAKVLTAIGTVHAVVFGTLAVLLATAVRWVFRTWTDLSVEELVFHLKAPLEGTNTDMVWDFFWKSGIFALLALAALIATFVYLRSRKNSFYITMISVLMVSMIVIGSALGSLWNGLDIASYRANQGEYSTFIDDNYVNPKDVKITFPEKKRNLIYIFLESMEVTYADEKNGGAFEKNRIPELTELAKSGEDFSGKEKTINGAVPIIGATWTMGAMFGQTSGIPLLVPVDGNSMGKQDSFFPNMTALGDILEEQGYNQELLIGSDAEFGGRKQYFTQHGNYSMFDYNYAKKIKKIPQDYNVWWGYEDKKLFDYAKEELGKLSSEKKPFNFTMLTVDTHFEDGYLCEDCPKTFKKDQYSNVMSCSSKKVADFIAWIKKQDFYKDTTIVIAGDHLTMDSDYCKKIDKDYRRKAFTTYINAPTKVEEDSYRTYTTFDHFPTTLASLGVKIEGNRLGLGTNLFSDVETLSERFGYEMESSAVAKKSRLMEKLAGSLKSEKEIERLEKEKVIAADMQVSEYDYQKGIFSVKVSNLKNTEDMESIRCAVWPDDDKSNTKWYEAEKQEDGSYVMEVPAANFDFKEGAYKIEIYAIMKSGKQVLIGEQDGEI